MRRSRLDEHPGADRIPVVVPLVLYHGQAAWTAPTSFHELLDVGDEGLPASVLDCVPQFAFVLEDLSRHSNDALLARSASAMTRLVLLLLKNAKHRADILDLFRMWAEAFRNVLAAPDGLRAIEALVRYTLEVNDHVTPEDVAQVLGSAVSDGAKEAVMTAAQRLVDEGIELGIERGIEQGIDRGQQRLVLRLAQLRFGEVPAEVVARIEGGRSDELEAWGARILTAKTLDEVFGAA